MQMRSKQHAAIPGEVAKVMRVMERVRAQINAPRRGIVSNERTIGGQRIVLGWARHERGWRRDPPPTPGGPASLEFGLGAERLGLSCVKSPWRKGVAMLIGIARHILFHPMQSVGKLKLNRVAEKLEVRRSLPPMRVVQFQSHSQSVADVTESNPASSRLSFSDPPGPKT